MRYKGVLCIIICYNTSTCSVKSSIDWTFQYHVIIL
uniref:Uncharacterized protein n=1 Tax=Rhizophora mucronata TaxID=61149 RepID=A0A2P2NCY1_RHIMU